MLATGDGQICGAQPGGWAPDARWVRSLEADHRVNWAHQRPTIYQKRQMAGRETVAPQISLNRMLDLRLRRVWTGHRPSISRSRRTEEEKCGVRGITKNYIGGDGGLQAAVAVLELLRGQRRGEIRAKKGKGTIKARLLVNSEPEGVRVVVLVLQAPGERLQVRSHVDSNATARGVRARAVRQGEPGEARERGRRHAVGEVRFLQEDDFCVLEQREQRVGVIAEQASHVGRDNYDVAPRPLTPAPLFLVGAATASVAGPSS